MFIRQTLPEASVPDGMTRIEVAVRAGLLLRVKQLDC